MEFSDLFQMVKSAVLVCHAEPQFLICYGNASALQLLTERRGSPLCCGSLTTLLHFANQDIQQTLAALRPGSPLLRAQAELTPPWGASSTLQVTAKAFTVDKKCYLVLTLEPEQAILPSTHGALLLSAIRAAHQAASAASSIEQLFSVSGEGLGLQRLALFEPDAQEQLSCRYEWHPPAQASRAPQWQTLSQDDFFPALFDTELPEPQYSHLFSDKADALLVAGERGSCFLLPISTRPSTYLLADLCGFSATAQKQSLALLQELGEVLAFFLRLRDQTGDTVWC